MKIFQNLLLRGNRQHNYRVTIDDFQIIQALSSEAYGKVCLAKKKTTGDYYAIKMIDREKTIAKSEEQYVLSEVNILRELNSDYIVKLYYSFQEGNYLYFVMDYMSGGDFDNLLQNCSPIEEKHAKLYSAEIIIALEYLHSKNIFYRDMKPNNILIDPKGHLKLTDFGLSQCQIKNQRRRWIDKYYSDKQNAIKEETELTQTNAGKRKGFVGTPHYLAPEIIKEQKGSFTADWWAVGIIMFAMLVGSPPFTGNTPEEIFENILNNKKDTELDVGCDEGQVSPEAEDLIEKLLNHDPNKRLGKNGAEEVKSHPFFANIKWDGLKDIEPPFIPEIVNPADTSYFPTTKFKVTDIVPQKSRQDINISQKQLGFNFDTTNVGTLAQKNKDAFKNNYVNKNIKKLYSLLSLDYDDEEFS